ncbi:MAG: hypothetical protein FD168_344 [Desulfobulbaceae bacterium]|nr:MAG: hypothetical protein FD168_344 [Desulfobulbaceae bacterium]
MARLGLKARLKIETIPDKVSLRLGKDTSKDIDRMSQNIRTKLQLTKVFLSKHDTLAQCDK